MTALVQETLFGGGVCQRWNGGRQAWAPAAGDRFTGAGYEVHPIDSDRVAKEFVIRHHYSGAYVAAVHRFGLYAAGALVGVAVYSNPATDLVLTNVFPELDPFRESTELGRFVLLDEVPGNAESWMLARCHEQLAERGVAGVVSFADPVPRRGTDGVLVTPGHVGTIYQASNATYTGRSAPRSLWVLPGGAVVNGQALQKIREQKQGHEYAERAFVALGAPPMRPGDDPREWLAEAKSACGVRTFRHPGLHRFAFAVGRTARARRQVRIALPARPYPKQREARELVSA